jgi:flagellar biosynthesis protein FlhB
MTGRIWTDEDIRQRGRARQSAELRRSARFSVVYLGLALAAAAVVAAVIALAVSILARGWRAAWARWTHPAARAILLLLPILATAIAAALAGTL